MNNIFSTLKSNLLFVASISLLLITQTAHADFRKALDAYQARDGATMLKEVKDAVDKKNDDGLILFLSVLERDGIFSQNFSFLFEEKNRDKVEVRKLSPNSMGKYVKDDIPWLELIPQNRRSEFLTLLQQATEKSSLESQFRFISLRSPYGLYDKFDYDEMAKIKLESAEKKKSNVYSTHFPMLANKGYNELLYFLSDFASQGEKPQWQQKLLNANSTRRHCCPR